MEGKGRRVDALMHFKTQSHKNEGVYEARAKTLATLPWFQPLRKSLILRSPRERGLRKPQSLLAACLCWGSSPLAAALCGSQTSDEEHAWRLLKPARERLVSGGGRGTAAAPSCDRCRPPCPPACAPFPLGGRETGPVSAPRSPSCQDEQRQPGSASQRKKRSGP